MCGIAGAVWTAEGKPLSESELKRMVAVLFHRGPDDEGFHLAAASDSEPDAGRFPRAALGHRRLSIIDLEGSRQPLSNEDGTVWIVFNGEIYNYRELRAELEGRGHRFRTAGDTEVIVHLYEEHGLDFVAPLRGMFAFAVWDGRRRRLVLARDRVGKKPLVYREDRGRLLFASELKSLLQVEGAPRALDPAALDDYLLYQYVPYPGCILQGYRKLPPAHLAVYENGRLQVARYWSPPYSDTGARGPQADPRPETAAGWLAPQWREELRERLAEAVRLRMRSDVPLGAFLSGGVDSTIIAGLMQRHSDRPVHTFSIGFPVAQFDERSYAREAAAHLGTEHHEYVVEPHALALLPRLTWHYDEPFADSSAIPTMLLAEATRREVTVALSGDGGDELFAGYDRYRAVRLGELIDRLPRPLRAALASEHWQRLPASVRQRSFRRRFKRLLAAVGETPERRYLQWIAIFDDARRQDLYSDGFRERLGKRDAAEFLLQAYARCPNRDFVTRTTCADVLTYLPCDILTKVDVASMAASLECRCPFLDHLVVELAARMPIRLKQSAWRGKRILVDTFADLLPRSIRSRPKMGFGVPLDHWFRGELRPLLHELLLDRRSLERGLFDPAAVRRLIEEHTSARWDHSARLWALVCLESWHRMFLDPAAPPASAPGATGGLPASARGPGQ